MTLTGDGEEHAARTTVNLVNLLRARLAPTSLTPLKSGALLRRAEGL